jgi:MFS family permease
MANPSFINRVAKEVGISSLRKAGRDVYVLLLTRYMRMLAYGSSTLILALFFETLGYSDLQIGLFMTLTLVGDVFISLGLAFVADAIGRKWILILGSLLMTLAGSCFAIFSQYWILVLAAIVGIISPSGNEIGPFRAVEESTLAQLSNASERPDIFAWYVVIGTLGASTGSLGCGWVTQALQQKDWSANASYRLIFWVYAAIGLIKAALTLALSRRCEVQPPLPRSEARRERGEETEEDQPFLANGEPREQEEAQPAPPTPKKKIVFSQLSRKSTLTLLRLCALFFLDSLASGMVPYTLITFYIERKFEMPEGQLGTIISAAQFMSSMGNIFASAVAKRIGLVRAMVYTHLPSAILLALIPAPPWLVLTVIILVLRASLASMDQAPRSAFLSAVVLPEERTATMGIVNTVKTMSQSSGPLITGVLADKGRFWIAFVIAGTLKASYDLGMLKMFVNTKLEDDKAPPADVANTGGRGERNEYSFDAENSQDGEDLVLENVKP